MDQISQTHGRQLASRAVARDAFSARVDFTIDRAQQSLIRQQHPEGYWQAALEANAEMNAEYIIFNRFMDLQRDEPTETKLKKLLMDIQLRDGSWTLFPGGPGHLSTSIE